jgi:enoyl-CoA hydratase/carnithine racemase
VAKLDLNLKDKVAVLTMNEDDNKLNLAMCNSLLAMLDRVERETEALTLVIKSGHDRIWSNGFDTDWITARLAAGDKATVREFLSKDLELRRRLLLFPLITIAAINGHVFGGGAVMSCCCDFRFMRADRGFFCIPVVDRGFPIVPGTAALLQNVVPLTVVEELVLTGHRFTGAECAASHIVAAAYPNDELMDRVMAFAGGLNKGRWIIGQMKQGKNGHVVKLMEEDLKYIEDGQVKV